MVDPIENGKRIHELRKQKGVTIEQAAIDNQTSYTAMQSYESGDRTPRDEVKERVADYYNVSVGYLFFGEQCH